MGLGNRLLCIASQRYLTGEKPFVFWHREGQMDCEWYDLFNGQAFHGLCGGGAKPKDFKVPLLELKPRIYLTPEHYFDDIEALDETCGQARPNDPDFPRRIREAYCALFAELRADFVPAVQKRVSHFIESHLGDNFLTIQIRSWRDSGVSRSRYYNPDRIKASILEVAPRFEKLFLTTDSEEEADRVRRLVGDKMVRYQRCTELATSRESANGMREDAIELLIAAYASEVLRSEYSTFGSVIHWMAGLPPSKII